MSPVTVQRTTLAGPVRMVMRMTVFVLLTGRIHRQLPQLNPYTVDGL